MLDVLIGLLALAAVMTLYRMLGRAGYCLDDDHHLGAEPEGEAEAPRPRVDAAA